MEKTLFEKVCINFTSKEINFVSNNYEWLSICWDDDLDLNLSERLSLGFQYWINQP